MISRLNSPAASWRKASTRAVSTGCGLFGLVPLTPSSYVFLLTYRNPGPTVGLYRQNLV